MRRGNRQATGSGTREFPDGITPIRSSLHFAAALEKKTYGEGHLLPWIPKGPCEHLQYLGSSHDRRIHEAPDRQRVDAMGGSGEVGDEAFHGLTNACP
jgi:hypothetical protein